jgi:hypothetical protein
MAEQLTLVRTYDFQADVSSVSLIDDTDGFKPAYDGWIPKSKVDKNGRVQEALTLRVQGTATDDIAASLGLLADKSREAAAYFADSAEQYAVWFRVQLDGETGARQALVYALDHQPASSVYDVTFRAEHHLNQYTLGIERGGWWENPNAGTAEGVGLGTISFLGGTAGYDALGGDLPARMAMVRVATDAVSIGGTVQHVFPNADLWLGVRSNRFGSADAFAPYWDLLGNGLPGGGTALADSQGRTGTVTAWGPHSATNRVLVGLNTPLGVGAAFGQQRGEFLVLLRAKLTGGTAVVQLESALQRDRTGSGTAMVFGNPRIYPRVYLEPTSEYLFREMGVVTIPHDPQVTDISDSVLALYSQTIAGTPTLYADGLYLIPTEAMVRINRTGVAGEYADTSDGVDAIAAQGPDGREMAYFQVSQGAYLSAAAPYIAGGLPPGDSGIFVLCAQRSDQARKEYCAQVIQVKHFERWKEMRGND